MLISQYPMEEYEKTVLALKTIAVAITSPRMDRVTGPRTSKLL